MKMMIARFLCLWLLVYPAASVCAGAQYVEVIPPRYECVSDFCEGLAAAEIDGKWGFIDQANRFVVAAQYDDVSVFCEGFAAVSVNEKWGFIDKAGKVVVPPKYDDTGFFHEGLASILVDDGKSGKWGFIDTTGREVVPPKYDRAAAFHQNLAMVWIADEEDWGIFSPGKWGYVDGTGREVVPLIYEDIGEFHEGRACVVKDGKMGFVDETGAVVIPLAYTYKSEERPWTDIADTYVELLPFFSEGLVALWGSEGHGDRYGYIDRDGNEVIPFEYDYAAPFSEGLAYVSKGASVWYETNADGKFGYIDKAGRVVVQLQYDCDYAGHGTLYDWFFVDGYAPVSRKGATQWDMVYGLVDRTGKVVVPIRYYWMRRLEGGLSFAGYGEDYSGHGTWDSIGLIDETGREIVAVGHYAWIEKFSEGYACVRLGGDGGAWMGDEESRYGFIDWTGREVVPCVYEAAGNFSEGLAAVCRDGKWGFIAIR